jgi:hypothetical protein
MRSSGIRRQGGMPLGTVTAPPTWGAQLRRVGSASGLLPPHAADAAVAASADRNAADAQHPAAAAVLVAVPLLATHSKITVWSCWTLVSQGGSALSLNPIEALVARC